MADSAVSDYEKARLQRIQRNRVMIATLDIQSPMASIAAQPSSEPRPSRKRKRNEMQEGETNENNGEEEEEEDAEHPFGALKRQSKRLATDSAKKHLTRSRVKESNDKYA